MSVWTIHEDFSRPESGQCLSEDGRGLSEQSLIAEAGLTLAREELAACRAGEEAAQASPSGQWAGGRSAQQQSAASVNS